MTLWTLPDPSWGPEREEYWWAVANPDGSWNYRDNGNASAEPTMTAAGLLGLAVGYGLTKDGSKPWCDAVPFLKDGQNIFQWPPK